AGHSIIVTNTLDTGAGSLRQAITEANNDPGSTITFAIPAADPGYSGTTWTIQPLSPLPTITAAVTIDATTQAAVQGGNPPLVELNGANAGTGASGLYVATSGATVKGFIVNRFNYVGIWLQ